MKKRRVFLTIFLLLIGVLLSACSGLIPLEEEPATGEYGPTYSDREHQLRTFNALWKNLEDSYIYYETSDINWDQLRNKYTDQINSGLTSEEFISLLNDFETELAAGSVIHQSRDERIEADMADLSTFDGIGAFVGFQGQDVPHIVILAVIEGSPAEAAGLKAHDSIVGIDGSPVLLEEGINAINRIRGPAGSSVTLYVRSPGDLQRSVEVKRAKLTSTGKLEADILPDTDYGYVLFPPIGYPGLDQEVLVALQMLLSNRDLKGLVLDLRIANSSQNWPLDTLFTLFHNGEMGELYNRAQKQTVQVEGQDVLGSQAIPLVILVGENTNGFSEIFAASLQMYGRAVIVGGQTPGEVETQSPFYLPDGSRVFIESTSFRLQDGSELGMTGVTPDVWVDAGWDEIQPANDPVLEQAIQILENTK